MNYAKLFFQNNLIKIIDVSLNDKPNLEPLFNIAADYAKGEVFFFLVNPSPLQFSRFPQNQNFLEIISLINLNSNNSSKVGVVGSTVIDSTTNFVISGGISASKGEENIPQLFHQFKGFHFGDKRLNGTKMKDKIAVSKNGMLVSRKIFTQVGGFNPKYSDQVNYILIITC